MSINSRWSKMGTVVLFIGVTLLPLGAFAQFKDQHSVESLIAALNSPISSQSIKEARDFDDKLMSEGQIEGSSVYLVTDKRSTLVNNLVRKLLMAMGQDTQQWVVRVLDTNPPIANAFVTGGKYIYVFTGLIKQAATEDELAFVLSHELGHSLLKHKERRKEDVTTTIGNIAVLAALLSKKHNGDYMDFAKIAMTSYSRGDEEEADAIAVAISRRAGYDPLRGADFFSRGKQQQDTTQKANQQLLAKMRQEVQQAQVLCSRWTQQYNSSWRYQSNENANRVNAICRDAENKRLAYNQALQQYTMASLQEQRDVFFRTHPQDQNRIAAIAALTDYVYGRRDLSSISKYEQSYRVMLALRQVGSVLLEPGPSTEKGREATLYGKSHYENTGAGIDGQKIDVVVPSQIEEGGIVPINVNVDGFRDDPIVMLSLSIDGNPETHRRALVLSLEKPQSKVFMGTRVRMASGGSNPITIQIKQLSGKVVTKTLPSGSVSKPVDFSNPDSLNVTFKGAFVFPRDEVGQPQIMVQKKKGDDSTLEIKGLLHHPMSPATEGSQGFYVNSVDVYYENEKIATFEIGDTLSNDPFLQLNVKNNGSIGNAKMVWRDSKGLVYEKSN